ncbi:MAG: hypothetical protein RJA87_1826 [Pseudomonadota bacterium]|jgi:uncharacterized protein (DUF952 family)
MSLIYKLLSRAEWQTAQAAGAFTGSAVDLADGYIHFSTGAQAQETARRYFSGQSDLMVLAIETDDLSADLQASLVWEPSRGGDLFPHLYKPLPVQAVLSARAVDLDGEGVPMMGDLD